MFTLDLKPLVRDLLTYVPLEFCAMDSTDSPLNATPADLLAASMVGQSLARLWTVLIIVWSLKTAWQRKNVPPLILCYIPSKTSGRTNGYRKPVIKYMGCKFKRVEVVENVAPALGFKNIFSWNFKRHGFIHLPSLFTKLVQWVNLGLKMYSRHNTDQQFQFWTDGRIVWNTHKKCK